MPARLIETANHFYTGSTGDWICLRLSRSALRRSGIYVRDEQALGRGWYSYGYNHIRTHTYYTHTIYVRDEQALPVGDQAVGDDWGDWVCALTAPLP